MDERTKALSEAVNLLRKNADVNRSAAREHATKGFYQAAADMDRHATNLEHGARLIESMYLPANLSDE